MEEVQEELDDLEEEEEATQKGRVSLDGAQVEEDDDAEGLAWLSVKGSEATRSEGRGSKRHFKDRC